MEILTDLERRFNEYGAQFRIVFTYHLKELKQEIDDLNENGKIDPEIHPDSIDNFHFRRPDNFEKPSSVIVIAVPQGISVVLFQLDHKKIKAVIPPTYTYRKVRAQCIDILSDTFGKSVKISKAALPLKLLAAHSGLGEYGKNNLCYIEGMGSFARLEAFYIEHRFDRDDWQNIDLLRQCKACDRCVKNCPTNCMGHDEFVIRAGRCITHHNEKRHAFPDFIDPRAHNSLIGCIRCQTVCPVNHPYLKNKTTVESFSIDETDLILKGKPESSDDLAVKLRQLDMDEYQDVLCRNLTALIKA